MQGWVHSYLAENLTSSLNHLLRHYHWLHCHITNSASTATHKHKKEVKSRLCHNISSKDLLVNNNFQTFLGNCNLLHSYSGWSERMRYYDLLCLNVELACLCNIEQIKEQKSWVVELFDFNFFFFFLELTPWVNSLVLFSIVFFYFKRLEKHVHLITLWLMEIFRLVYSFYIL